MSGKIAKRIRDIALKKGRIKKQFVGLRKDKRGCWLNINKRIIRKAKMHYMASTKRERTAMNEAAKVQLAGFVKSDYSF